MATKMTRVFAQLLIGTALGSGPTTAALAQTAPAATPAATSDANTMAEIVVTAQKRTQNVQDVPLAVQVVGSTQLQAAGVRDFNDLTRVAPSLIVRPAENPVNASISMRGVGTFAFAIGVEPSVAVVLDDVPVTFQARAFADLSNIERIEVLRGPQSSLYGKAASAGLISIITPAPSKSFTASMSTFGTTDSEYGATAAISGPLTPTIGFRSNLNYDNFKGNIHDLATGHKINGRRNFSTRNKLAWDPSPDINVWVGIDYINGKTTTGRPFIALDPAATLNGIAAYTPAVFAPGVTPGPNNRDVVNNYVTGTKYHDFDQSLHISWDLGGPTFLSITSHDKFHMDDTLDQDESAIVARDNRQTGQFNSTQFSQEFRLVSPGHDRFRYTLGLFYTDLKANRPFVRGPFTAIAHWYAEQENKLSAGFGQLEFDILPKTTLIAGGRYSHEKVSYLFHDFTSTDPNNPFTGSDGDSYANYKLGVQQHLDDNVMLFATYATGHKGETYDLTTGFNRNRQLAGAIKPETSKDWEAGARTEWLDRRLTLNVTAFSTKYRDYQAQGIEILPDGTTNYRLANVGALRTRGVEMELGARPTNALSLGASLTYDDAKITNFPAAQCFPGQTVAQGCIAAAGGIPAHQNLAGFRPPQAPQWKGSANFDWTPSLGNLPFEGLVQGAWSYQSKVNYLLSQDPRTVQPGYGILNLTVGIRQPDKHYEVALFVNNMFDKQYYVNFADSFSNYGSHIATQAYLPRDFRRYAGIRASVTF